MSGPCAAAPYLNAPSSAANQVVLVRKIQRRATVPTTASRLPLAGKTRSRFLTAEQADLVRQQIDTGRQFRGRVDALWKACELWADSQLADVPASSGEAQKGGSKPIFKTKSRRKSKLS